LKHAYGAHPAVPDQLKQIAGQSFLGSGHRINSNITLNPPLDEAGFESLCKTRTITLWIYVEVVYADRFEPDRQRTVRACRKYFPTTGQLVVANEAGYEYAD
jgi:hypothetical protein